MSPARRRLARAVLGGCLATLALATPAAADSPVVTVANSARLTTGDDLLLKVRCVKPVSGRTCKGKLRMNVAAGGGGGGETRARGGIMGGITKTISSVYSIPKGVTELVRFEFGSIGTLLKGVAEKSLNDFGRADQGLMQAEAELSKANGDYQSIRPELFDVMESLRKVKSKPDTSATYKLLTTADRQSETMAKLVAAAAKGLPAGDTQDQVNEVVGQLSEAVGKLLDPVVYLGHGQRAIISLIKL